MADISAIKLDNTTYTLKDASSARTIDLSIDNTTYVLTATLKDASGTVISTSTRIDLPLETMVVGGEYVSDDPTYGDAIKLELNNGTYVTFPIGGLVSGLQSEITSTNTLDADLVDDSTSTNKFVTAADKTAWNAKSDFSGSYNDLTDKPTIPAAVTVDQTYDTTSTNPQSGTAVAQAIAKKPGEITTGKQYTIDGQTVTAGEGAEAFNNLASNMASGMFSHAEGVNTTASGFGSHAEGASTKSSGDQSHSEGSNTIASNLCSHAEGQGTTSSGAHSHSEGAGTIASGDQSHSEGSNTTASGAVSHAEGSGTKASSANQHVQGKYNVEDANSTYAFIIGNGTANNARHNAFAIDWSGLIYVNGATTGVDVSQLTPVTVDQTYDTTSTNPQSGTAVAQAIAALNIQSILNRLTALENANYLTVGDLPTVTQTEWNNMTSSEKIAPYYYIKDDPTNS